VDPCQGNPPVLTSVGFVIAPQNASTKIVPATRDCPMCGGTMRLREIERVVRVPGNPNATSYKSREWVCPDCDYFEDVEEET
jgi:rubredoxin